MRTDIADLDGNSKADLALNIDGVLLHAGGQGLRIDQAEIRTNAGGSAQSVAHRLQQPVGERIGEHVGARFAGVNSIVRLAQRGKGSTEVDLRCPEQPVAAPHYSLAIDLPGDAGARSPLVKVVVANGSRRAAHTRVLHRALQIQAGNLRRDGTGGSLVKVHDQAVVLLLDTALMFPAQTRIQGDLIGQAEVVLNVSAIVGNDIGQLGRR